MKKVNEIKTFDERKQELIEIGQKKGYITFEQLANALKGLDMDADSLDQLYNTFIELGISVITEEDEASGGAKKEEEVVVLDDEDLTKDVNINDPVRMYLKEIGRISLLTTEEEMNLSIRAADGDEEARNTFIHGNLRLVLSVIQRFYGRGESADDLFQVGCVGLIKAIDNFDLSQNVQFSTYAVPMIIRRSEEIPKR